MSDRDPVLGPTPESALQRPHSANPGATFVDLLRAEAGVVFCSVLISALIVTVALLMLESFTTAKAGVDRLAESSRLAVVVSPSLNGNDAETLKGRLSSIEGLGYDRTRTRQELLTDIQRRRAGWAEGGGQVLPEVWLFSVRSADGSLVQAAARAAKVVMGVPGVEAVRWDEGWLTTIDRGRFLLEGRLRPTMLGVAVLLALGLVATCFMAGRGLAGAALTIVRMRVFAYLALLVATLSLAIAFVARYWMGGSFTETVGELVPSATAASVANLPFPPLDQGLAFVAATLACTLLGSMAAIRK